MKNIGIMYGHLEYCKTIWYILREFGICRGHLVCISSFGMLCQEKFGNPGSDPLNQTLDKVLFEI
jgi:hypothetical protein